MNLVYVLVPFFKTDTHMDIERKSLDMLGLDDRSIEEKINVHEISPNKFAVEIKEFNLHFMEMNSLIEEHEEMKRKVELFENLLKDYEPSVSNIDEMMPESQESLIKKMKKYKELKEENKKLKKLLQVQLENTEKVREETQKTMKVLREEFDALVVEISRKEKSSSSQSPYECHSNPPELESNNTGQNNKERHSQSGGGAKHISSIR